MLKKPINIAILGHVDCGKSTFVGSLMSKLGLISQKTLHKNLRDSKKIGKESFHLAWNTDQTSQERERGITIDISNHHFETERFNVTIIDCPGHKDYLSNAICGITQADAIILVIDVIDIFKNPIQSSQTYEHIQLSRIFGISEIIVCINKMDIVGCSNNEFKKACDLLNTLFKKIGINNENVYYIPVCAKDAINIVKNDLSIIPWYSGPCLLATIDLLKGPENLVDHALRISISAAFKLNQKNVKIFGKIESGCLSVPSDGLICPMMEIVSIEGSNDKKSLIEAGNQIELNIKTISDLDIGTDSIICDPDSPLIVTDCFMAHIGVFELPQPLLIGSKMMLHSLQYSVEIQMLKIINIKCKKSTKIKNLRIISDYSQSDVIFKTVKNIAFDIYEKNNSTGRFVLRLKGITIGTGKFISKAELI